MKAHHLENGTPAQEQAALWLTELDDASPGKRAECIAWLKESPEHVREFLFMVGMWEGLGGIDAQRRMDVGRLLDEASAKVLTMGEKESHLTPILSPAAGRRAEKSRWLAGAAVLAVAMGAWWIVAMDRWTTYSTATGEQRMVKLPDGSMIHLNTRSKVTVDFDDDGRDIRLLEGEALFTVAHDARRPFRVHAADAVIQALGTRFNLYRRPRGTTVSVVEGLVRVSTSEDSTLTAGEQLDIANNGVLTSIDPPDIARATAWLQRQLIFRGDPLESVAAEVNRYNDAMQIKVEGKPARERRMIGVFAADDPESLIQFLENAGDLAVERRGGEILIRAR